MDLSQEATSRRMPGVVSIFVYNFCERKPRAVFALPQHLLLSDPASRSRQNAEPAPAAYGRRTRTNGVVNGSKTDQVSR